jgi:hypothetical protein
LILLLRTDWGVAQGGTAGRGIRIRERNSKNARCGCSQRRPHVRTACVEVNLFFKSFGPLTFYRIQSVPNTFWITNPPQMRQNVAALNPKPRCAAPCCPPPRMLPLQGLAARLLGRGFGCSTAPRAALRPVTPLRPAVLAPRVTPPRQHRARAVPLRSRAPRRSAVATPARGRRRIAPRLGGRRGECHYPPASPRHPCSSRSAPPLLVLSLLARRNKRPTTLLNHA